MCGLHQLSGLLRPVELAEYIQTKLALDQYDTTAMRRYASGSQFPIQSGHPYACGDWVKLAARIWPESSAWFRTPFWFLLEKTNLTPDDLVICAGGLPPLFRESLLEPSNGSAALKLIPVSRDYLYGFTDPINPWSLGALACAMRRSEFAADAGAMRWASVGIMWSVNHFIETVDPLMRQPLEALLVRLKSQFDGLIYPTQRGILAPITDIDIARFDLERESFLEYFDNCEFDNFEPGTRPPWTTIVC